MALRQCASASSELLALHRRNDHLCGWNIGDFGDVVGRRFHDIPGCRCASCCCLALQSQDAHRTVKAALLRRNMIFVAY